MLFKENTENSNVTFCIKNPTVKYGFQLHQDNNQIEIETLEKVTVTCHPSDYIITEVIGEHWVVNQKNLKLLIFQLLIIQARGKLEQIPILKSKQLILIKIIKVENYHYLGVPNGTKKEVQYTKEDVLI